MKASERAAIDMAKELTSGEIKKITFGSAREGMSGSGQAQLAACELLHELGRCKREEYGQWLIFSDFWLGDGPRPASPEDMATWVADVAQKASACALPADHPVCHVTEAVAIAKVVAKAMDLRASNSVPRKWKIIEEGVAEIMAKQAKEES